MESTTSQIDRARLICQFLEKWYSLRIEIRARLHTHHSFSRQSQQNFNYAPCTFQNLNFLRKSEMSKLWWDFPAKNFSIRQWVSQNSWLILSTWKKSSSYVRVFLLQQILRLIPHLSSIFVSFYLLNRYSNGKQIKGNLHERCRSKWQKNDGN